MAVLLQLLLALTFELSTLLGTATAYGGGAGRISECSEHCHCGPLAADRAAHSWLVSQSAYRLQSLLVGRGHNYHRVPLNNQTVLRHMTCVGITEMPRSIPPDVKKLVIYGDTYGPAVGHRQRDEPSRSHVDWDQSFASSASVASDRGERHQISSIDSGSMTFASSLEEVFVEGNNIQKIRRGDFHRASRLRLLSFRGNKLEEIESHSLEGLRALESADFSMNRLQSIGRHAFTHTPQLRKLSLSDNRLTQLRESHTVGLRQLTSLDLSKNSLELLDAPFSPLYKLSELNLCDNKLAGELQVHWFASNSELQSLRLARNGLTAIVSGALMPLATSLRELDLSGNTLTLLGADYFVHLVALEQLDLSDNVIETIEPGAFRHLRKLQTLRLSGNALISLESHVLHGLGALQALHLERNRIEDVHADALRPARSLRHLHLSRNRLHRIRRRTLRDLYELREFSVEGNRIRHIEDEAFAVADTPTAASKLTWLRLQGNQLTHVGPYTFHGLPFLRHLDLSDNVLQHVDRHALRPTGNLLSLSLAGNRLTSLQPQTFGRLRALRTLSIRGNSMVALGSDVLSRMASVEELDVSGNELTAIADGALADLPRLTRLDLSQNLLPAFDLDRVGLLSSDGALLHLDLSKNKLRKAAVPASTASGKRLQLKSLDLSDNVLEYLSEATADAIGPGGELRLHSNPWTCDCLMSWLPKLRRRRPTVLAESPRVTCKVPSSLAGAEIAALAERDFACYPEAQLRREKSAILCKKTPEQLLVTSLTQIRSRKELLSRSVTFVRRADGGRVCGGVLVTGDLVLAPSWCWLDGGAAAGNLSALVAVIGTAKNRKHLANSSVTATPAALILSQRAGDDGASASPAGDVALVRLQPADAQKLQVALVGPQPCILDRDQYSAALVRRATGRAPGRKLSGFRVDVEAVAAKLHGARACELADAVVGSVAAAVARDGDGGAAVRACARTVHKIHNELDMTGSALHYDLHSHWAMAAMHVQRQPLQPLHGDRTVSAAAATWRSAQASLTAAMSRSEYQLPYAPLYPYADWIDSVIRQSEESVPRRQRRFRDASESV